ncbi:C40 family peptidase [Flavobacterium aurantiibacter]|uniref:NlpC/P60 domain-containing protein n=1 Tax=Flavobacterium aurantiibacter TaxID=2023067 RepID=A0A255ZLD0_9FLAO|nr:C40 family peptidase [Flavobacterium aurantiibacter]OYQ42308.1 hypothetical protein CHX27_12465 [Flavobacterium aurantiibacter]
MTRLRFFFLISFLMFTFVGSSQIITSKKQAMKKGVYQPRTETTSTASTKTASEMAAAPKVPAATKLAPAPKPTPKPEVAVAKPKPQTKPSKKNIINEEPDSDLVFPSFTNYLGNQMINNAMGFLGVRYRGGGTTPAGMDCSGMVTAVLNIFDIKMPRSSHEMAQVGEKVDLADVQAGDLIFFKTNGRSVINHVGMVVEIIGDEIKFIHSSTNKGVIISSTKEPYYKRSFVQINRIPNKA